MSEEKIRFIDTHGHVNFSAFKDDGFNVIERALTGGVGVIMPGSQIDTSRRAVEYAEKLNHPYIRAAVGLHPIHLEDIEVDSDEVENQPKFHTRKEEFREASYEDLIKSSDKIVAIGEVGLDYWRLSKDEKESSVYKARQIDVLNSQLELASQYGLPAILHCRKAHDDLLSVLEDADIIKEVFPPGVIHCYTGGKKQLKAFLSLGFYIGYNGIIFKMNLDDVIKATPLDRILLETDSPYLTPPFLGNARNEPMNVKYVAEKIAEIKGVLVEEVANQTTDNAAKVFKLNAKPLHLSTSG